MPSFLVSSASDDLYKLLTVVESRVHTAADTKDTTTFTAQVISNYILLYTKYSNFIGGIPDALREELGSEKKVRKRELGRGKRKKQNEKEAETVSTTIQDVVCVDS